MYDVSVSGLTHATTTDGANSPGDDLDILEPGPAGGTVNVNDEPDLEVDPTISSSQVVRDLLGDSEDAVIIDEPTLMIYPQVGDAAVTYKIGWVASVDDGENSREVVVDAFSGATLATERLVVHADYSRTGTVSGYIRPRNHFDTRSVEDFENLKVWAVNLVGQIMDTDETDSDGDYDLSWSGATATYLVGAELEGQYIESVSDEDNTDLDHWTRFSTPYTATYDWTWSKEDKYLDQMNIFYHTDKMARWYESNLYNVTHNVKLVANADTPGASAWAIPGSTPKIEFSDAFDSEQQADIIYHEYAHSVSYKLHGSFIGSSGQAAALEEGMADYFAQTLIGHHRHRLSVTGSYRELKN